jgi:hypothetical protein
MRIKVAACLAASRAKEIVNSESGMQRSCLGIDIKLLIIGLHNVSRPCSSSYIRRNQAAIARGTQKITQRCGRVGLMLSRTCPAATMC